MPKFLPLSFRKTVDLIFLATQEKANPTTIAQLKDRRRHGTKLNHRVRAIEAIRWQAIKQRKGIAHPA